jgi:Svf1-like C-terminal lipocalin-like domain/Svf1-like N-terminal lipocalin domain
MRANRIAATIAALTILTVFAAVAYAAVKVGVPSVPKDLNRGITAADEAYNPQSGKGYLEVWDFWAEGADGSKIVAQILIGSIGVQNSFPGYMVTYAAPGKESMTVSEEFDADTLAARTDRLAISFPRVMVSGRHPKYRFKLEDEKLKMDLTFVSETPGIKFDNKSQYKLDAKGEDFFRTVAMAPRAKVSGTITTGGKTAQFSGMGYADHVTQNVLSTKFSKRWTALRFHGPNATIIHSGFKPTDSYQPGYYGQTIVIQGSKIVYASNNAKLTLLDSRTDKGYPVPGKIKLSLDEPGCKLDLTMDYSNIYNRVEILDKLNVVTKKIIGTFFARPVIFRASNHATATIDLGAGPKKVAGKTMGQVIFVK